MMTDARTMGKGYVMDVDAVRVRICESDDLEAFRILKQARAMPL